MEKEVKNKSDQLWCEISKQKEHFLERNQHHVHYSLAFSKSNFKLENDESDEPEAPDDDAQAQDVHMSFQKPIK